MSLAFRWVFPAKLTDDTNLDLGKYLYTGFSVTGDEKERAISYAKPDKVSDFFPSQRWSKLFDNLRADWSESLKLGYVRVFEN